MPVIENNDTGNEADQQAKAKALADTILDNFELPESLANKINETEKKESEGVEEVKEEEAAEEVNEEAAEEKAEPEAAEEEKEDEDLIPKSTFQKRLDEMTREKKQLELRLKRLEGERLQAKPQTDEDMIKLEKMSESELQSLKKQVRLSQLKNASDDAMVGKLFELEDKIETVMKTAPQRFASSQVQQFNDAVQLSSSEIQNFDKHQKDIFQLAKRIYDTAPELHQSVSGQARAWNLAVEHYKLLQEANVGKTKIEELDRKVNTLKKRVSLDGVSKKAVDEPDSDAKLFKKAKNGEFRDKLEFIRKRLGTDAVVDSFMESR